MTQLGSPSPPRPSADGEPYELDIPPAIACARCGQSSCEGCQLASSVPPSGLLGEQEPGGKLPWETWAGGPYLKRLIVTAAVTVHPDQECFKTREVGPVGRALHFAIVAEGCAIASFAVPWALAFAAVFPEFSWDLLQSPQVLWVALLLLPLMTAFVVGIHVLWGVLLEWAIQLRGIRPAYKLGQRFGLYACGWDLIASPAGILLLWWVSDRRAVLRALGHARRVPRRAVFAYLEEGRNLERTLQKRVVTTGIIVLSLLLLAASLALLLYLLRLWI